MKFTGYLYFFYKDFICNFGFSAFQQLLRKQFKQYYLSIDFEGMYKYRKLVLQFTEVRIPIVEFNALPVFIIKAERKHWEFIFVFTDDENC